MRGILHRAANFRFAWHNLLRDRRTPRTVRYTSSVADKKSRIERINGRLPNWLSRYTSALVNAPISHISAFLILHELTAIIPLLSLTAAFHYTQWLPPFISEWKWVSDGMQKFGNYFRRKGWIEARDDPSLPKKFKDRWWGRSEKGTRIVVEFASAWALTKVLLPVRIPLSVWATPWFARTFIMGPAARFRGLFRRSKAAQPTVKQGPASQGGPPVAGTGATEAGAISTKGSKP